MAFFTKAEARQAANSTLKKSYGVVNSESILDSINESVRTIENFDIFLSHSSKDAELVLGVKTLLENQGLKVYVDWHNDPQMSRNNVTAETADLLRSRMKQSKSLVYMATENSSGSKWMPWELGYFDGFSGGLVAILPLVESSRGSFRDQEYLAIYPMVTKDKYADGVVEHIFVENKKDRWMTLESFGRGNTSWNKYTNS